MNEWMSKKICDKIKKNEEMSKEQKFINQHKITMNIFT